MSATWSARPTARSVRAHNPGFRWAGPWHRSEGILGRRWARAAADFNGPWTIYGPRIPEGSSDRTGTSGATTNTTP